MYHKTFTTTLGRQRCWYSAAKVGTQPDLCSLVHRPQRCVQCSAIDHSNKDDYLLARAKQLYEVVWSEGKVLLLDTIMAEDHAQNDRVWQVTAGIGRKRMKRGILAYRAAYPDIKFKVEDAALVPGADKVFVHWNASGTNLGYIREQPPTGALVEFAGISLLEFNTSGQIQQSIVFRQAPSDEMSYFLAAEKSKKST